MTHTFTIPSYQYLNDKCEIIHPIPAWLQQSSILEQSLYGIYLSRALDQKAINMQRTGQMGTYPAATGQEAIGVGIALAMRPDDIMCGYYRDQTTQLLRGIKVEEILRYWGGYEDGNNYQDPNRKHDMPICVPIATQSLHAVGIAYAQQYRNTGKVVVTTIGDGGTSQGDFYEALNAAALWKLPLVFIINNNQWAISISRGSQTAAETLAQKALAAGMEGVIVDGNDVFAMAEITKQAIEKARNGGGPTLIEAQTFRLCDHTTVDDASRYIPQSEIEEAKTKEPLLRLTQYAKNYHQWSDEKLQALQQQAEKNINQSLEKYFKLPAENHNTTWQHLYETLPIQFYEQSLEWNQAAGGNDE